MEKLLKKIRECTTMPQLDELRRELVTEMTKDEETFNKIQSTFIKQKNKLKRIPLKDRDW